MLKTISSRFVVVALLLGVMVIALTDRIYNYNSKELLLQAELRSLDEEVREMITPINHSIDTMRENLLMLSEDGATRAYAARQNIENREALAAVLQKHIAVQPYLMQVRFIDASGEEVIRFDRRNEQVVRVEADLLQDKSRREYVQESSQLGAGQIYVSPVEPNREFGKIIRPVTYVLRTATPIYAGESYKGLLLFNLNVTRLLADQTEGLSPTRTLYVTDELGRFIAHPDLTKVYGMRDYSPTIQEAFSEVSDVLKGRKARAVSKDENGNVLMFMPSHIETAGEMVGIYIALSVVEDVLLKDLHALQERNMRFIPVVLLLVAGGAALLARMFSRPLVDLAHVAEVFPGKVETEKLPTHRSDEIGVLARSLRNMVHTVSNQQWVTEGKISLMTSVRALPTAELVAKATLKHLCEKMNAPLGAFYRVQDENTLFLLAQQSLSGQASAEKVMVEEEGMLSQALNARRIMVMNNLPDGFYTIRSGLGEGVATKCMLIPLVYNGKPVAIIEIAGMQPFSAEARELAERCSEGICVALLAVEARTKVNAMLSESLQQKERLEKANEQLEATRKELELKNQQRHTLIQELSESNSELERFAYVASHDLQEPLRMIRTFSKLLATHLEGKTDEVSEKYLRMCMSSAERMQILIQDMLEYARLGQHEDTAEFIKTENILTYVIDNLEYQIEKTKAEITFGDLPDCWGLPVRISRVFQNLISNALRYHKPEEAPKIHISGVEKEYEWEFCVADEGIGIAPEYFDRIFEPFRRLHGMNEQGGSGLGLSICKKVIENMGGEILVESEPGVGTCFYFTLPRPIAKQNTKAEAA